jgi:hypothetical protein
LTFYRSDKETVYQHIDLLFKDVINWERIAKDALSKSKRPQVKKLAQEIISSQQKEIDQLTQWGKAWYKQ